MLRNAASRVSAAATIGGLPTIQSECEQPPKPPVKTVAKPDKVKSVKAKSNQATIPYRNLVIRIEILRELYHNLQHQALEVTRSKFKIGGGALCLKLFQVPPILNFERVTSNAWCCKHFSDAANLGTELVRSRLQLLQLKRGGKV